MTRVLVLGASGMLGNAVFRFFAGSAGFDVRGTVRSTGAVRVFPEAMRERIVTGVDVDNVDSLARIYAECRPAVVINCIGLVKQLADAKDPLFALPINSILPHRLARLAQACGARMIHVSTDCVFAGTKGKYREGDAADADDLYGRSKYLGELAYPWTVTLRTSIIGHETGSPHGLVGWFLSQERAVKGFRRAVFSGLPTVELARVMRDFVLPQSQLSGVYHVAAEPINKYELLKLIARQYAHAVDITPDDAVVIDRSLDATRFQDAAGYLAPAWPELVRRMHEFG